MRSLPVAALGIVVACAAAAVLFSVGGVVERSVASWNARAPEAAAIVAPRGDGAHGPVLAARADAADEALRALEPDWIARDDRDPVVRVRSGLEVVRACRDYDACEVVVRRVDEAREDRPDQAGAIAIAHRGRFWIVAPAEGPRARWSRATAYVEPSLERTELPASALGGPFSIGRIASQRAAACTALALLFWVSALALAWRARALERAQDLVVGSDGRVATTGSGEAVRLDSPLPAGNAIAWSIDDPPGAYRTDAMRVARARSGSRAALMSEAADRSLALSALAAGTLATGLGVLILARDHVLVLPW